MYSQISNSGPIADSVVIIIEIEGYVDFDSHGLEALGHLLVIIHLLHENNLASVGLSYYYLFVPDDHFNERRHGVKETAYDNCDRNVMDRHD